MDVSAMMNALQQGDAAKRVASGLVANRGNGMQTAATAAIGFGREVAPSGTLSLNTVGASTGAPAVSTSAAAASNAGTSNITSGDFLTLLVAEMKNQDPTQPTDPNAYIQQLVGVNSLQQLISINSELGKATGGG